MRTTNADIAELLVREARDETGHLSKAFRRASRRAFTWSVEASDVHAERRSLTELAGVGPYLAPIIAAWIEDEAVAPEPPPERANFLTLSHARRVLRETSAPAMRGDLQMHSTWSDGGSSIGDMAAAAVERRYEYIAITDHSKGLHIVKNLDEEALVRQALEIERVNGELSDRGLGLRVLRSIEMNLSPSGGGDLSPNALAKLDLVLGSFHSSLRHTDDQTERYLAAIANPHVHILGHPRGRVYNFRLGLTADWPRVFAAAAEADKAIEIDAYPDRQDLDAGSLRLAAASGTRISIGTDAHAHWQLEWIDLGIASAISAGIAHDRILNLMSRAELLEWVAGLRSRVA